MIREMSHSGVRHCVGISRHTHRCSFWSVNRVTHRDIHSVGISCSHTHIHNGRALKTHRIFRVDIQCVGCGMTDSLSICVDVTKFFSNGCVTKTCGCHAMGWMSHDPAPCVSHTSNCVSQESQASESRSNSNV